MWQDIVEVDSRKRQIAKQKAKAYQMHTHIYMHEEQSHGTTRRKYIEMYI